MRRRIPYIVIPAIALLVGAALWFATSGVFLDRETSVSSRPVASIVDIKSASSEAAVIYGGDTQRVATVLGLLNSGERLRVVEPGATVYVQYFDGSTVEVSYDTEHLAEHRAKSPALLQNIQSVVGDKLAADSGQRTKYLVTRGQLEPLRFATHDLTCGTAQVSEGDRSLLIRWVGGRPPFRVVLREEGGGSIVESQSEIDAALMPPARLESERRYELLVIDSSGESVSGTFRAVAYAPPKWGEARAGRTGTLIRAYEAVWLAQLDSAKWSFESLQLVASLNGELIDRAAVADIVGYYSSLTCEARLEL